MREILPDLYHWTTHHERIGQEVGSHFFEPVATAFDPRLPDDGIEAFEGLTEPSRILLSARHHLRHSSEFVEAFGAGVSVHHAGLGVCEEAGLRAVGFDFGDEPATGVRALPGGGISDDDTVFHIDTGPGALLFADSLINMGGQLGFVPEGLLGDDAAGIRRAIVATLSDLLEGPTFDALLFAHGDPVVEGGRALLDSFVRDFDG